MMMSTAEKKKDPDEVSTRTDPPAARRKTSSSDAVANLERRLRMLEEFGPITTTKNTSDVTAIAGKGTTMDAPSAAATGTATSTLAGAGTKQTGKSALLARIMAAQEKAKQAQNSTLQQQQEASLKSTATIINDPPPAFDLLDETFDNRKDDPPPSFDVSLLPPTLPPPAFDAQILPPPSSTLTSKFNHFDPMAAASPTIMAPPAPSAPAFEDVYVMEPPASMMEDHNATYAWEPQAPPPQPQEEVGIDPATLQAIMSLDGLSEADKRALIDEQLQVLKQMTQQQNASTTQSAATSAADAFEQRSLAMSLRTPQQPARSKPTSSIRKEGGTHAGIPTDQSLASQVEQAQQANATLINIGSDQKVPLHGPEKTKLAIQSGIAVIVQCLGCEHAMQVTPAATLMFCPVCETISAVNDNNVMSMTGNDAAKAQLEADLKLAEELQKEEYKRAEGGGNATRSSPSRSSTTPRAASSTSSPSAASGGWLDWLGVTSTAAAPAPAATSPARSSSSSRSGLIAANTDTVHFSSNSDSMQQARVAESKPLFSCVADSIMTTANQYMAATLMDAPDEEGNVHGVDSSSLLAVPMSGVGRNAGKSQNDDDGYSAYE
ncbi:hypothetical protein MPSEU_000072100 [Mayamaea pseudoterrestris]|nr:hypothetical protein MPSEU_000072100 [Mayamaea pseudoterrestris]